MFPLFFFVKAPMQRMQMLKINHINVSIQHKQY